MPFVLRHAQSSQIFTCVLVNNYKLPYFGVKFWEDEAEAAKEAPDFLAGHGVNEPSAWQVLELEEQQLKICNVRLKNDPRNALYWGEDAKPEIRKIPD